MGVEPRRPSGPRRGPFYPGGRALAAFAATLLALVAAGSVAHGGCPIELAVYREDEIGAEIEFRPGQGPVISNAFSLLLGGDLVLEGFVMWTSGVRRPIGAITHGCPEGDVTGAEIDACTVWSGVIYTGDEEGGIDLLPTQGTVAPQNLLLPDLGRYLRYSTLYGTGGLSKAPWDIFTLSGCQE